MKKISFFLILVIAISVWLSSCELINFNNDSDEKFDVEIILHTENGDLNISKNGGPIVSTSWEPALIETAYISVKNNTSADLKCDIALEAANIVNNINEVLTFIAVPDATFDTPVSHKTLDWSASNNISIGNNLAIQNVTIAPGGEYFFAISLRMDETAGNEYQGGDVDFNIKVLTDAIAQNNEN